MARPSLKSADEKLRILLAVLKGELTASKAARRHSVSEQSVHNWKGSGGTTAACRIPSHGWRSEASSLARPRGRRARLDGVSYRSRSCRARRRGAGTLRSHPPLLLQSTLIRGARDARGHLEPSPRQPRGAAPQLLPGRQVGIRPPATSRSPAADKVGIRARRHRRRARRRWVACMSSRYLERIRHQLASHRPPRRSGPRRVRGRTARA